MLTRTARSLRRVYGPRGWHLVLLAVLLPLLASAADRPRPRLAVLLVVDQLSGESLNARLRSATGGFARLARGGFRYRDPVYEAAPALTSSGHASLATGTYPQTHGIVGNDWVDPTEGKSVYSCQDDRYLTLGRPPAPKDGTAPTRLRSDTLGDSLKASIPGAKVVAIGGKDRSTILLGGGSADVALWLDSKRPAFTSSTWYGAELPAWVKPLNDELERRVGKGFVWSAPRGYRPVDDGVLAKDVSGYGRAFPHVASEALTPQQKSEVLLLHPYGDSVLVDAALAAIDAEKLGQDGAPDLLTLSFAGYDKLLHAFGEASPEIDAAFSELDQALEKLLQGLDKRLGKSGYVVALTSDHGGAPTPERIKRRKVDAGRVDLAALLADLEREADRVLGPDDWFLVFHNTGYYVHPKARSRIHEADAALRAVAVKHPGVLDLWPKSSVATRVGRVAELYRRGFDPDRSPNFFLLTRPYWLYGTKDVAGHASFHHYDRSVALLLYGAGIKKGAGQSAELVDVAPTLAFLLGSTPPSDASGKVLIEALQ